MGDLLCLVVTVQVLWRRGECRVGSAANDDTVLAFGHRFHKRTRFIAGSLPRHPFGHSHHHIDHQITLTLDFCVGVHLQKRKRPTLARHAEADLAVPRYPVGFRATAIVEMSRSSVSVGTQ
jgi:hypothetical protein